MIDLTDKTARFPVAYGYQPVQGWGVYHEDIVTGQTTQRVKKQTLAEGPWDGLEQLWADAFEILPGDYVFHPGDRLDAVADAIWPGEGPHPFTASLSARTPTGISAASADKLFGRYRCLRTANYDRSGRQIDASGSLLPGGADPRDYYFFKPNPANVAADQILRWGKLPGSIINWPAWCDWRDWNDEHISWDDAKYTPRSVSLTPAGGGSLIPGTAYRVRVETVRGADISSASQHTASVLDEEITLVSGQTAIQAAWLIRGDELSPAAPPTDMTAYRVFIGVVGSAWSGYFIVSGAATRSLLLTTLAGATAGTPAEVATAGLLRQIPRFQCMPFFVPPYSLAAALNRICQISCADWQWSGLGTGTFRNDMVRFMSPQARTPVYTLDLAQTGAGTFRMKPVDTASRPNQIVVNFRDLDSPYLEPADPVILDRDALQALDGAVKTYTIDLGTAYRSQAQRVASFWARTLCDAPLEADMEGSPKTYHVLPGDPVAVTNNIPDWTDQQFMVVQKQEFIESKIGDPLTMRLYNGAAYSDTDHSPLPSPLPPPRIDPFATPPLVVSLVLTQTLLRRPDASFRMAIHGSVQFAAFQQVQRGRVRVSTTSSSGLWTETGIEVTPDPTTLQAAFDYPVAGNGTYFFKVVTESALGVTGGTGAATAYSITVAAALPYASRWIETMRVRPYDVGLGFYLAAFPAALPSATQVDLGADLWRSRDGTTWEFVLPLDAPATAGDVNHFTTLDTNGVGLAAANTINNGSAGNIDVGFGPGQAPTSASGEAAVRAGFNAALVGRERIGFISQTFDVPSGDFILSGLLRGQDRTEHAMEHAADEQFILLNDAVRFVPCLMGDIGVPVSFKVVPRGVLLSAVVAFVITLSGESIKGALPLDAEAARSDNDWGIAFNGRPTPEESPAQFGLDIVNGSGVVVRTLPVQVDMRQAALLIDPTDSTQIVKNAINYELGVGTAGYAEARTAQQLDGFNYSVEGKFSWSDGVGEFGVMRIAMITPGQTLSGVTTPAPFAIEMNPLTDVGIVTIKEGGVTRATFSPVYHGPDPNLIQPWRIVVFGSEIRYYQGSVVKYRSKLKPAGPYRGHFLVDGGEGTDQISDIWLNVGDRRCSTIYAQRQQENDFGSVQAHIRYLIYQIMPNPLVPKGQVLDVTF